MLQSKIEVTESDFEIDLNDGSYLPILDIEASNRYYVTYGHIPGEEMVDYCNQHLAYMEEDLDDFKLSEEDVVWTYAVAFDSYGHDTDRDFVLRWNEISPDEEGSFPITLVTLW